MVYVSWSLNVFVTPLELLAKAIMRTRNWLFSRLRYTQTEGKAPLHSPNTVNEETFTAHNKVRVLIQNNLTRGLGRIWLRLPIFLLLYTGKKGYLLRDKWITFLSSSQIWSPFQVHFKSDNELPRNNSTFVTLNKCHQTRVRVTFLNSYRHLIANSLIEDIANWRYDSGHFNLLCLFICHFFSVFVAFHLSDVCEQ